MKTKIIVTGILLCVVAGCGIFNSKKFHPHHLDGLYKYTYEVHDPGQDFYSHYIFVDYPKIQICATSGEGIPPFIAIGKEEIKIAHIKGNDYKISAINGNMANNENIIFKITKDASSITYLNIMKIKNGKEGYTRGFQSSNRNKAYQKCISEAPDTTGIFTDTLQLDFEY